MPDDNVSSHWRELGARLDGEVASVTPSLVKKESVATVPTYRRRVQRRNGKRIYVVLFTLRDRPAVRFIKIGISGLDIRARFQPDARHYEISLVAESEWYSDDDAQLTEGAIHAAFRRERFRPPVALASGNTECFVYTEANLARMREIISRG